MNQIILASGSPRRRELLHQIGLEFEVCPAQGEEKITTTNPQDVVLELSKQKAEEVAAMLTSYKYSHSDITIGQDTLIIGADTVVANKNQILGKPRNEDDAKQMLTQLSGNTHSVYTGVTCVLIDSNDRVGEFSFFEKTDVSMYPMTNEEIERYVATGEPMDKAGAYGIQGKCAIHIKEINGDYNNVVGLPIARLYQELLKVGIDIYTW